MSARPEVATVFRCLSCGTEIEGQQISNRGRDAGIMLRCRNGHDPVDMREVILNG